MKHLRWDLDTVASVHCWPNPLSCLHSSFWCYQQTPWIFWRLDLLGLEFRMKMFKRNWHFHPSCPLVRMLVILKLLIFCCLMIILWTTYSMKQSLLSTDLKKSMMLRLVTSIYTTLANLWRKNPVFNLKSELGLMLVCSLILKFLHSFPWTGFCSKTFAYFDCSYCLNSSGYFFNFYLGWFDFWLAREILNCSRLSLFLKLFN